MRNWKRHMAAFWGRVLAMVLPDHAKRILFILTLYRYVKGSAPNEEDLVILNERFNLATTDTRALVLPSMLKTKVWAGDGASFAQWSDEMMMRRLLTRCPCWLRYGRDVDIMKDAVNLRSYFLQAA